MEILYFTTFDFSIKEYLSIGQSLRKVRLSKIVFRCTCILLTVVMLPGAYGAGQDGELPFQNHSSTTTTPCADAVDKKAVAIYPPQREGAIYFAEDSEEIAPEAIQILLAHATELKADRSQTLTLTGYLEADRISSMDLAMVNQRIESISVALEKSGVLSKQIRSRIHYEAVSTKPCVTESCRISYRRVDFHVASPSVHTKKRR